MIRSGPGGDPEPSGGPFDSGVWLIYDGECPMCTRAATAFRVRETAGSLTLIDARSAPDHALVREASDLGYDLDEGMVLRYAGVAHHGEDALFMMAMLGSTIDWFNRLIVLLFRSHRLARLSYPLLRLGRNVLLAMKGVSRIDNLADRTDHPAVMAAAFCGDWVKLPPVMRDHYAIRNNSADRVMMSGHLDVESAPWIRFLARVSGMLVPYSGENIPVDVTFTTGAVPNSIVFDRTFHFPGKAPVQFRSTLVVLATGDCIELMKFGIGWRLRYRFEAPRIVLEHRGYVWRIFGRHLPLPLGLIMGKAHAEETPHDGESFSMWTHTLHPWFGKTFAYHGRFRIVAVER